MVTYDLGYSPQALHQGAILGSIAHAIWVVGDPVLAGEQQWTEHRYLLKDYEGSSGAVSFSGLDTTGAFFSPHGTHRSPVAGVIEDLDQLNERIPVHAASILTVDCFPFLMQKLGGREGPVVTGVLWSEGQTLHSLQSWEDLLEHGGHLIQRQLLPTEEAIPAWCDNYEFSAVQEELLSALVSRKLPDPFRTMPLTGPERKMLLSEGSDGLATGRQLLSDIGIEVSGDVGE